MYLVAIVGSAFALYGLFGLMKALISALRASGLSMSSQGFVHIVLDTTPESEAPAYAGDVQLDEDDIESATIFRVVDALEARGLVRKISLALLVQFLISFAVSTISNLSESVQAFAVVKLGGFATMFLIPFFIFAVACMLLHRRYPWNFIIATATVRTLPPNFHTVIWPAFCANYVWELTVANYRVLL
jgi:hypothetical protein